MKKIMVLSTAVLALSAPLVLAQGTPESLLPPGFRQPSPPPPRSNPPTPRPQPGGQQGQGAPSGSGGQQAAPGGAASTQRPAESTGSGTAGDPYMVSNPVIQQLPSRSSSGGAASSGARASAPRRSFTLPPNLPSLEKLEAMDVDELDEFLGLKPKYDIPPAARRSLDRVGILDSGEGGLPSEALARQPAAIVSAALKGNEGPMVSRWGHILLRRALSSRLASPEGLDPVDFAAMRAALLNRMGEFAVARAVVQDIDTSNWNPALTDAALNAYLGTADIVGACPALRLQSARPKDAQWTMWKSICAAYAGEAKRAEGALDRALKNDDIEDIDALLAQRYAGAASAGRRAVNIEWDNVNDITPWRFALAGGLGIAVPDTLSGLDERYYVMTRAQSPLQSLQARLEAAPMAGEWGILSAASMVDLYAIAYNSDGLKGDAPKISAALRDAYGAPSAATRLEAIRKIWGEKNGLGREGAPYALTILTAYAAARMPASSDFGDDAAPLIASMLSAGLDRDALAWGKIVPEGSPGWGLLVLTQEERKNPVDISVVDDFYDNDDSAKARRTGFLLAGLAGLGRIDKAEAAELAREIGHSLGHKSRWSTLIDQAAAAENKVLVAYLAGVGMQGESWQQMTARQLYHIVAALNRVGLKAEARMIAAEAVARG